MAGVGTGRTSCALWLLLCFLLLRCYMSTLEPSLKALSLKALSPTSSLRLRLNTRTRSMGGTIRVQPVSDLMAAMHALAARIRALVVCSRQT
jgi:hypothetical protein